MRNLKTDLERACEIMEIDAEMYVQAKESLNEKIENSQGGR